MNAPVTFEYVLKSSDSRSFPIRPRIYIPKYDPTNSLHARIVSLSRAAHAHYDDPEIMYGIGQKLRITRQYRNTSEPIRFRGVFLFKLSKLFFQPAYHHQICARGVFRSQTAKHSSSSVRPWLCTSPFTAE